MARIAVIEDSDYTRERLREALQQAGHTVLEAKNGIEGLKLIESHPTIQLIITDYHMPGTDGISMIASFRRSRPSLKTPVVMFTTETSEVLKAGGKEVGVVAWIIKPFIGAKLTQVIDKLVGSSPASAAGSPSRDSKVVPFARPGAKVKRGA